MSRLTRASSHCLQGCLEISRAILTRNGFRETGMHGVDKFLITRELSCMKKLTRAKFVVSSRTSGITPG
jgi:hypothetical protein